LLGIIAIYFVGRAASNDRESGTDCIVSLPLRVCDMCQRHLNSDSELKALLSRVPVYRALLEKYPNAKVTLSSQ
jgi:hypothetical protein